MSEEAAEAVGAVEAVEQQGDRTAGELLRSLREAQGVDLAALASALKVPVHKLELLESDRFQELPGMAFVRSLTQSMCRQLHVDAKPVMALLPSSAVTPDSLETVSRGLAEPFREPATRTDPTRWPEWLRPTVLGPAVLLLAALGFWFAPGRPALDEAHAQGTQASQPEQRDDDPLHSSHENLRQRRAGIRPRTGSRRSSVEPGCQLTARSFGSAAAFTARGARPSFRPAHMRESSPPFAPSGSAPVGSSEYGLRVCIT